MNTLRLQFKKQRWIIVGFIIWFSLVIISVVAFPSTSHALTEAELEAWCGGASLADEEEVTEYVQEPEGGYKLEQPISGVTEVKSAGEYLQLAYQLGLGLVGIIAVVIIMFGGLMWVQAAGNEQRISSAKELIVSAVVGLLIALLSYTILVFVNPEILRTELNIAVIPVQTSCPYPPPEVEGIPVHDNLTKGGQLCPTAINALQLIAGQLSLACEKCKIGVGSTFRSSDRQQELRSCYERAIDEGYYQADKKTPVGGKRCPSGCTGCNPANKPCCSNHERGFAMDLWLEFDSGFDSALLPVTGIDLGNVAPTSEGKLSMSYENGGGDAALANNQKLLQQIMEQSLEGKQYFKRDAREWWHFNLVNKDSCVEAAFRGCNTGTERHYCKKNGADVYTLEECDHTKPLPGYDGTAHCNNAASYGIAGEYSLLQLECPDGSGNRFDPSTNLPENEFYFSAPPTCPTP